MHTTQQPTSSRFILPHFIDVVHDDAPTITPNKYTKENTKLIETNIRNEETERPINFLHTRRMIHKQITVLGMDMCGLALFMIICMSFMFESTLASMIYHPRTLDNLFFSRRHHDYGHHGYQRRFSSIDSDADSDADANPDASIYKRRVEIHISKQGRQSSNRYHYRGHSTKMNAYQIISRCVTFWIQAAPILVHYQFTQLYLAANPNLQKRSIPIPRNRNTQINHSPEEEQEKQEMKLQLQRQLRQQRRDDIYQNLHETYAPKALALILQMRGLFVKIGQVLSSRADFMPFQYIDLFQTLQDDIPPPLDELEITEIVRDSLRRNHGLELEEVFEGGRLREALGAASIGQVHKGTLTEDFIQRVNNVNAKSEDETDFHTTTVDVDADAGSRYSTRKEKDRNKYDVYEGGREVAVKVMHADAEDRFRNDFKILKVRETYDTIFLVT